MLLLLYQTLIIVNVFSQQNSEKGKQLRKRGKDDDAPKAGEKAPIFKIKSLDGKTEFNLEDFRDKKPVILFFGSYT